jgi:hypothetical protein
VIGAVTTNAAGYHTRRRTTNSQKSGLGYSSQGQRIGINQEFDAAIPNAKRYVVPASTNAFASVTSGQL